MLKKEKAFRVMLIGLAAMPLISTLLGHINDVMGVKINVFLLQILALCFFPCFPIPLSSILLSNYYEYENKKITALILATAVFWAGLFLLFCILAICKKQKWPFIAVTVMIIIDLPAVVFEIVQLFNTSRSDVFNFPGLLFISLKIIFYALFIVLLIIINLHNKIREDEKYRIYHCHKQHKKACRA